jgi:hypothetical protein
MNASAAASAGRNRYLQAPTGLFGGDATTYDPMDAHYSGATAYLSAVTTPDRNAQRCPTACWYATGTGAVEDVRAAPGAGVVVRMPRRGAHAPR